MNIGDPVLTYSLAFTSGIRVVSTWLEQDPSEDVVQRRVVSLLDGPALGSLYGLKVYYSFLEGIEYALRLHGYETTMLNAARGTHGASQQSCVESARALGAGA
jgi:hypothetical protein